MANVENIKIALTKKESEDIRKALKIASSVLSDKMEKMTPKTKKINVGYLDIKKDDTRPLLNNFYKLIQFMESIK